MTLKTTSAEMHSNLLHDVGVIHNCQHSPNIY